MELSNDQWEIIEPVFRHSPRQPGQPGRPRREPRGMVDAILWILRTGAPWADLPRRYPPYQTCHRWFSKWSKAGVIKKLLTMLVTTLQRGRGVDDSEGYIDGSYAAAKKGGDYVGKSRAGNATKIMALADSAGLPIAVTVAEGCRHDVSLVDQTLEQAVVSYLPQRLIGDKAFDSAQLAQSLSDERHIKLIAPKRKGSRRRKQDGRAMRRYKRRWKVERLFSWLKRFRRVATRWDNISDNYLGFLQLAAAIIVLRRI